MVTNRGVKASKTHLPRSYLGLSNVKIVESITTTMTRCLVSGVKFLVAENE